MRTLFNIYERQQHPYQILPYSPYPFLICLHLFIIMLTIVGIYHEAFNEVSGFFSYLTPK